MLRIIKITCMMFLTLFPLVSMSDSFKPSGKVDQSRIEEIEMRISSVQNSLDIISQKIDSGSGPVPSIMEIEAKLLSQGLAPSQDSGVDSKFIGILNGKKIKEVNGELYFGESGK